MTDFPYFLEKEIYGKLVRRREEREVIKDKRNLHMLGKKGGNVLMYPKKLDYIDCPIQNYILEIDLLKMNTTKTISIIKSLLLELYFPTQSSCSQRNMNYILHPSNARTCMHVHTSNLHNDILSFSSHI